MSRGPSVFRALALAALLAPGIAYGQRTEQELTQRLDTLLPLLEQARIDASAARAKYRTEMEALQPTEGLRIGLVHVRVVPGQTETAQDVIGPVWSRDFAGYVDRSPSLDRDQIYFQWAVDLDPYTPPSNVVHVVRGRRWRSRSYMEDLVADAISGSLKNDLSGTRFEAWGISGVRAPRDPSELYRRIVVAPSTAVRRCVDGDDEACLVALGLRDDGYLIDDWYSPEERRLLVMRQRARFGAEGQERDACLAGSRSDCDAAIRRYSDRYDETRWASPVSPEVHASFLWYALQQGGPGAWGRLLSHAGDAPIAALEAASTLDAPVLARGWRTWMLSERPATHADFGALAMNVLFWCVLLSLFATRSTRWRLG